MLIKISNTTKNADYVAFNFMLHSLSLNLGIIQISYLDFTPGIGAALFSKLELPTRIDIQGNHTRPLYYSLKLISYKNTTFVRVLKMMTKTMTKAGILFFEQTCD